MNQGTLDPDSEPASGSNGPWFKSQNGTMLFVVVSNFKKITESVTSVALFVQGSKVVLSATPQDVKESLTSSLVIHCALNDTAASSAIIGRRDVTQTTENVVEVTSFILMKNGKDVASMSHTKPAHVMDGSSNIRVTGSVVGTPGEASTHSWTGSLDTNKTRLVP